MRMGTISGIYCKTIFWKNYGNLQRACYGKPRANHKVIILVELWTTRPLNVSERCFCFNTAFWLSEETPTNVIKYDPKQFKRGLLFVKDRGNRLSFNLRFNLLNISLNLNFREKCGIFEEDRERRVLWPAIIQWFQWLFHKCFRLCLQKSQKATPKHEAPSWAKQTAVGGLNGCGTPPGTDFH